MSAFVVNPTHITYLVQAALTYGQNHLTVYSTDGTSRRVDDLTANQWGQILTDTNYASVNHRYAHRGTTEAEHYSFPVMNKIRARLCPVQTLKAIDCYVYQACEHDGWEDSDAQRFCDALRSYATSKLPGYETAAWEVQD